MTYDIRVVEYHIGGSLKRILRAESIDFGTPVGAPATLSFSVSETAMLALGEAPISEIAEYAVEVWNDDTASWIEPDGGRFVGLTVIYDETDDARIVRVGCLNFVAFVMGKGTIYDYIGGETTEGGLEGVTPGTRHFKDNPGFITHKLIEEVSEPMNGLRWGTPLNFSFTATHDSNGQLWASPDSTVEITYQAGTSLQEIVDGFVNSGAYLSTTTKRTLNLYIPKLNIVKTDVRIGGKSLTKPVNKSNADLATHTVIRGEESRFWHTAIPGAFGGFGRLEMSLDGGGVTDQGTASALAGRASLNSSKTLRQYELNDTAALATHFPHIDYNPGDVIWVYVDGVNVQKEIKSIQLRKSVDGEIAIDVILEHLFDSTIKKLAKATDKTPKIGNGRPTLPRAAATSDVATYGVVGEPIYNDGGLVRVLLDGFSEITDGMAYRKLAQYEPAIGDRVYLAPAKSPDVYIVAGRMSGAYTQPPPGEPMPDGNFEVLETGRYGLPHVFVDPQGWITMRGKISIPDRTGWLSLPEELQPLVDLTPAALGTVVRFRSTGPVSGRPITLNSMVYNNNSEDAVMLNDAGTVYAKKDINGLVFVGGYRGVGAEEFGRTGGYFNWYRATKMESGVGDLRPLPSSMRPKNATKVRGIFPLSDYRYNVIRPDGSYNITTLGQTYSYMADDGFSNQSMHYGRSQIIFEAAEAENPLNWIRLPLTNGYRHGDYTELCHGLGPLEYAITAGGLVVIRGAAYGGFALNHITQLEEVLAPTQRVDFVNPIEGSVNGITGLAGTCWIDPDGKLFASGNNRVFYGGYHLYAPQGMRIPEEGEL